MSDTDLFEPEEECPEKVNTDALCEKPLSNVKIHANIDDECDVIPETPPGGIKKKKMQKKRVRHKETKNYQEDYLTLNYDFNFKCKIQSTRTGSFDFNKPYMYHSIDEVLKYTEKHFLKNNNIHLIGIYKFTSRVGHYLNNYFQGRIRIALDLTLLTAKVPDKNDVISVFGSVELGKNGPVFVVKFFRQEVEITIGKYMENLKILRNFIPVEYFKTLKSSGDFAIKKKKSEHECNSVQSYS